MAFTNESMKEIDTIMVNSEHWVDNMTNIDMDGEIIYARDILRICESENCLNGWTNNYHYTSPN